MYQSPLNSLFSKPLALIGVAALWGMSFLFLPPLLVLGLFIALLIGLIIFFEPFWGVLSIPFIEYLRPTNLFPVLGEVHLARIVMSVVILSWLTKILITKKVKFISSPLNWAMLAFLGVIGASIFVAILTHTAFNFFLGHLQIVITYFLITNLVDSSKKAKMFIWVFLLANAWVALTGLSMYVQGQEIDYIAMGGFIGDANDFAMTLNAVIPYAFFLFLGERSFKLKSIFGLLLLIYVSAVILSFSRGGILGLTGLIILSVLHSKFKLRSLALLILFIILIFLFAPPRFFSEVKSISPDDPTAISRRHAWEGGIKMFLDHPFLGAGAGNFPGTYGRGYIPLGASSKWMAAHSIYIQLIGELGLAGILCFGTLIFLAFRENRRLRQLLQSRGEERAFSYSVSKALDISIVGYLLSGFFLSALYYPHLYLIIALIVTLKNIETNSLGSSPILVERM